ncbi:hypothetical protein ABEB36_014223 [Hypothenemus hampei]|uniref:CCHC-type domain-containing protein n=1 Tax=Hypothenemus hampei TaxID=57062 RepID=A0ABD1E403_HYPHA
MDKQRRRRHTSSSSSNSGESPRQRLRESTRSSESATDQYATLKASQERISELENLVWKLTNGKTEYSVEGTSRPIVHKTVADCIPFFNPANKKITVSKWIARIEQLAEMNGWNDQIKIDHMQTRLSGVARSWYNNLSDYKYTWIEWKELFMKTFPEHNDFAHSLRTMMERKKRPGESWDDYYYDKIGLIRACEIGEKNAVSCLIDGIEDVVIRTGAKAGRYVTPEDLYSEYFTTLTTNDSFKFMYMRKRLDDRINYGQYSKFSGRQNLKSEEPSKRVEERYQYAKELSRKCFNCGVKGHYINKCPKAKKHCSNCKLAGHVATECRRTEKCLQVAIGTNDNSMCNNQCYFVNCEINGIVYCGYIDTGCTAVIIKHSVVNKLGLKVDQCCYTVDGYGNGRTVAIGKVIIDLEVDLAAEKIEAIVVDDNMQSIPILIGQTFINKNKTLIVKNNEVRLVADGKLADNNLNNIPPKKMTLICSKTTVIPPHSVRFIEGETANDYMGSVYIERDFHNKPGEETELSRPYISPGCRHRIAWPNSKKH